MADMLQRPQGYEWIQWLTGEDAQLLAWQLCQWIEDPTIPREGLTSRIRSLQRNAHRAVGANAWNMRLDNALGLHINEWLHLFDKRMRAWEGQPVPHQQQSKESLNGAGTRTNT
jgi:hypothetical protein